MPATREPAGIVNHAQRAQCFDQRELAGIEVAELAISTQYVAQLRAHLQRDRRKSASISPVPPVRCGNRPDRQNADRHHSTEYSRHGNRRAVG